MVTAKIIFFSTLFLRKMISIRGTKITVKAQRNPEFDKVVYFTPKVAPA